MSAKLVWRLPARFALPLAIALVLAGPGNRAQAQTTCTAHEDATNCGDGKDNDCDGLFDAADPDCAQYHCFSQENNCSDGLDDDCDGLPDSADPDCGPFDCFFDMCPAAWACGYDGSCYQTCFNGYMDGSEGDVDCGGACAARCSAGQHCYTTPDCASGSCVNSTCVDTASAISYGAGFTIAGLQLNGSATLNGTRLRLTSAARQAGSAFATTPVGIQTFTTDFRVQLTNASADGITFALQGTGPTALGPLGGGLGYGPDSQAGAPGIGRSVALKLDLYSNAGEGNDSTGVYLNGASPTVPAVNLAPSGVDLHSGHPFDVHVTYDGATLAMKITDATTGATATASFSVNIPAAVGGTTAYAGFTGGTGGLFATQEILSWKLGP